MDRNNVIQKSLEKAKFNVSVFPSLSSNWKHVAVSLPEDAYKDVAEEIKLVVELKESHILVEYSKEIKEKFIPFSQSQRQIMLLNEFNQYLDIKRYFELNFMIAYFPLHTNYRDFVYEIWENYYCTLLYTCIFGGPPKNLYPLFITASYLGEEVAIYFAWLSFYTMWLAILAIPGIIVTIFQFLEWTIDSYLIPIYALVVSLWITIMNQMWKRREASLAYMFNTSSFKKQNIERPDHEFEVNFNRITVEKDKISFIDTFSRSIGFSVPLIVFGLGCVAAAFIGCRIWSALSSSIENSISVGVANGVFITALSYSYKYVSEFLTNMENHRYQNDWDDSYIVKMFSFEFINGYISLFAIAFYDENITDLAYSLGSIFAVGQFINTFINFGWPWLFNKYKKRKVEQDLANDPDFQKDSSKKDQNIAIEFEYNKPDAANLKNRYNSMIMQLGYIAMFSTALPIAPFFAFLHNLFALKLEVTQSLYITKRNAADSAKSIGMWKDILDVNIYILQCIYSFLP